MCIRDRLRTAPFANQQNFARGGITAARCTPPDEKCSPSAEHSVQQMCIRDRYKDSREQFERRTHKRLIDVIKPSQKTVEALMSLELPAGVEIEIKL